MKARWDLELKQASDLSPSVRRLVFEVLGQSELDYEPGEFIEVFVPLPDALPAKRAYSIANAPGRVGPGRIEIAVTRVPGGLASRTMHELSVGTRVRAEPPRGSLRRWNSERNDPALFVAAGSGLAPLRAILQEELSRPSGPPVALLFGARTEADILWASELRAWDHEHERFRLHITLSRPAPGWQGRIGYVQSHVDEIASELSPVCSYVCGLSAMVTAVSERLKRHSTTIRTELYD